MSRQTIHGSILCGVIATPDLAAALDDYHGRLGLEIVERGTLTESLARSWGTSSAASAPFATLRPASGAEGFLRLVQTPLPANFAPTTSFGWAAFEITVQDVFGWPARLSGSGFDIVGPPLEIEGLPYFVAMQMLGRGREMIYLNEVACDTPTSDLPKAGSPVDHIFIVILATPDREASMTWYRDHLRLENGSSYTIVYSQINNAFGLPDGTLSTISMMQRGRMPIVEVDDYPEAATPREAAPGQLPPGNALVSLAVDSLDALDLEFIAPPARHPGPLYAGRRSATVRGHAGELLELIEIG